MASSLLILTTALVLATGTPSTATSAPRTAAAAPSHARLVAMAPCIATTGPVLLAEATQVPQLIMRVQAALFARDFDPGAIDGVLGQRTRSALRLFQFSRLLPVTGTMTTETLHALCMQSSGCESGDGCYA